MMYRKYCPLPYAFQFKCKPRPCWHHRQYNQTKLRYRNNHRHGFPNIRESNGSPSKATPASLPAYPPAYLSTNYFTALSLSIHTTLCMGLPTIGLPGCEARPSREALEPDMLMRGVKKSVCLMAPI
jgi:hypothetical protein